MEPLDDELRGIENELGGAFGRREPAPAFTERVMKRVRAEGGRAPQPVRKSLVWRWAAAGAMAASLALGVYFQRNDSKQASSAADEQAATELMLSLQLAGKKINKARDVVLRRGLGETGP